MHMTDGFILRYRTDGLYYGTELSIIRYYPITSKLTDTFRNLGSDLDPSYTLFYKIINVTIY